jgi:hypothetical protein
MGLSIHGGTPKIAGWFISWFLMGNPIFYISNISNSWMVSDGKIPLPLGNLQLC